LTATGAEYTETPGAAGWLARFALAGSLESLAGFAAALASGEISSTNVLPSMDERSRTSALTLTSILATARPAEPSAVRAWRTRIESTNVSLTLYWDARRDASPPGKSTTINRSVGLKTV
jgi:hypothetical protein